MKTITSNEAHRLLEATWGIYGIQSAIQAMCNSDEGIDNEGLYNLSFALKVLVDTQHELASTWAQEAEGDE